jgi:MOSC domain-containing protein YiiM
MIPIITPPSILESIQIGAPKHYGSEDAADPHDQPWTTGFFKTNIEGPVFVGGTNLAGDAQADLINHGGIDKAVLAYSADHYPLWREELKISGMPAGAFGENLTISGMSEKSVCIGDVIRIACATFEVSQPRQPCWKLARRWRMHELTKLVVRNGRSGWYLRVLEEGWIEPRMPVKLVERPNPAWTIARANEIMNHHKTDLPLTLELANVPRLAESWVEELRERADRLNENSFHK